MGLARDLICFGFYLTFFLVQVLCLSVYVYVLLTINSIKRLVVLHPRPACLPASLPANLPASMEGLP